MRSQSNHHPMLATTGASPKASTASTIASPSCVPATLRRPARIPCRRLLAMTSVTFGPGTMMISTQARQ